MTTPKRKRHWLAAFRPVHVCAPARRWMRTRASYADAWRACERPAWMLWLIYRIDGVKGPFYRARDAAEETTGLYVTFRDTHIRDRVACNAIRAAVKRPKIAGLR